jgi:hypothetical protein
MSCELDCEDLKDVGFEELVRKMVVKTEDGCYALRVIDEGSGGGGGSYTFPANHGNVAYIAVDGNDGTGVVGNISKPFENCNAAIAALDNTVDGALIILSSTGAQTISDYDYTANPYNLMVKDYSGAGFSFANSNSFGKLMLETKGIVAVSTDLLFVCDEAINIDCDTFLLASTTQGAVNHIGVINCNTFTISANTNNPSIDLGTINWKVNCDISEPLNSYVYINPKRYRAILAQSGVGAPTVTTVLENTLGASLTYAYLGGGNYRITSGSNPFTANKTVATASLMKPLGTGSSSPCSIVSTGEIQIFTFDTLSTLTDELIDGGLIEIEVYP